MPVPMLAEHVLLPAAGSLAGAPTSGWPGHPWRPSTRRSPPCRLPGSGADPEARRADLAAFLRARLDAPRVSSRRSSMPAPERASALRLRRAARRAGRRARRAAERRRGALLPPGAVPELRVRVDEARLAALAPDLDQAPLRSRLAALCQVVAGDDAAGAVARLPQSERFGWLVAPSSTIIQRVGGPHLPRTGGPAAAPVASARPWIGLTRAPCLAPAVRSDGRPSP